MPADLHKARELFLHAVGKLPPEQWDDYVAGACGNDADLAQQVRRFLQLHREAGSFLEAPVAPRLAAMDDPAIETPGAVIGPYKLIEQIDEGGMGTVWMAQQTEPVRRVVALKLIKAGMDSKQVIARFEAERQALALMDHPNIAKVLDGGTVPFSIGNLRFSIEGKDNQEPQSKIENQKSKMGRPYFVMELVKGVPITKYCDEHHLTPRERLELFIPVCQAIQHAHQKGIIHRDLKPSNILVALYDGKPVPKVIDFGVAKAAGEPLTEQTLVTGFGAIVGTLEYMSPEQAEVNQLDIDTRSDIYSLGVLLYELLTGSPPFTRKDLEQAGMLEMLRVIREQEPSKPSTKLSTAEGLPTLAANRGTEPAKLTKLVRGELDWIVMKALEKDRNRRYETANGFAMDVQRYLAAEPVRACPPTRWYRFRKLAQRNRVALTTATLVALAVVAGAVVSAWQAIRATRAEVEARDAERAVKGQLWRAQAAEAAALRGSGRPGRRLTGLERLDEALRIVRDLGIEDDHRLLLRNEVIAALALPDLRLTSRWPVPLPKAQTAITFDAALARYAFGADVAGTIAVRRVADQQQVLQLAGPGQTVHLMRFSADGRFLAALHASSGLRFHVRIWDLERNALVLQAPFLVPYSAVEFSPDGGRVAVGETDGSIRLYELPGGAEHKRLAKGVVPYHLAFHPEGGKLAVSGYDSGLVQVRDLETGDVVKSLQHKDRTRGLAWRGDGKLLAVACGPRIAVWEADAERLLGQWEGHESEVIGVAFSQRGDRLASSSWETFTRLWDVATGRQLMSTTGGHGHVYALQFAADDQRLGYALEGPNLGLWEVAPGHECRILVGRLGPGRGSWGGDFSPDGRLVALADRDALRLWDVAAGEEIGSVPEECWAVCFARDGKALLTTGAQGLKSWPLDDNPARHDEAHAKRDPARTMRIGPAKSLREGLPLSRACLSDDGQLLVATVPTPQTAALIVPLDDPSRSVVLKDRQDFLVISLSPDKRWVASGSFYSRGVKIWDAQSGKVVRELATPWATTVAFSPDGGTLVTCTRDEYVFWDVKSWQPRRVVERHEVAGVPGMMDFAPDGKTLAIAHNPSLVQLRDVATGDQLATLEGPSRHEVGWLRFSRDGARLAVGCANGQVHVWDLRMVRQQLAARGLDWQE